MITIKEPASTDNTCHHTAVTQLLQSYPVKCNHSTLIEETTQTFRVPGSWRTRTTGQTHVVKHHTHTHTQGHRPTPPQSVAEDGSRACVAVVGKKAVSSSFQMLQERRHRVKRSHIWASAWLSAVTGSPNISKCTIQAPEADASNKAGRKICGFPWAWMSFIHCDVCPFIMAIHLWYWVLPRVKNFFKNTFQNTI